jgi:hypothetical protein
VDACVADGELVGFVPWDAILAPSVDGLEADSERSGEVAAGWFGVGGVLDRDAGRADKVLEWEFGHWSGLS